MSQKRGVLILKRYQLWALQRKYRRKICGYVNGPLVDKYIGVEKGSVYGSLGVWYLRVITEVKMVSCAGLAVGFLGGEDMGLAHGINVSIKDTIKGSYVVSEVGLWLD